MKKPEKTKESEFLHHIQRDWKIAHKGETLIIGSNRFKPTYKSDVLTSNFTSTTTGAWLDTGLSFIYRPPVNCYFVSLSKIRFKASNGGDIWAGIIANSSQEILTSELNSVSDRYYFKYLGGYVELDADTQYTIYLKVQFSTAGTITVEYHSYNTKLKGFFIAR